MTIIFNHLPPIRIKIYYCKRLDFSGLGYST